jgi:hypothetical protein
MRLLNSFQRNIETSLKEVKDTRKSVYIIEKIIFLNNNEIGMQINRFLTGWEAGRPGSFHKGAVWKYSITSAVPIASRMNRYYKLYKYNS